MASAPGDQHDVALAPADADAGVVQQGLGIVPSDGRDHELGGLVALGQPEAVRHQEGGVGHLPAQRCHHPDAVGASDERVAGRGRPARRGPVTVLRRRPQRRCHERQRLGPGCGGEAGVRRRGNLAHADQDGGTRVECHGPRSVLSTPRGLSGAPLDSVLMRGAVGSDHARLGLSANPRSGAVPRSSFEGTS